MLEVTVETLNPPLVDGPYSFIYAMSSTDPNQTLYIKGLPEKVRVEGNCRILDV